MQKDIPPHIEEVFEKITYETGEKFRATWKRYIYTYCLTLNKEAAWEAAGFRSKDPSFIPIRIQNIVKTPKAKMAMRRISRMLHVHKANSAERLLEEIARLAFVDYRKFYDEYGQLLPIHELPRELSACIKEVNRYGGYKLHSKQHFLNMLMRYKAMYHDKVDIGLTKEIADALINALPKEFQDQVLEAITQYIVKQQDM